MKVIYKNVAWNLLALRLWVELNLKKWQSKSAIGDLHATMQISEQFLLVSNT